MCRGGGGGGNGGCEASRDRGTGSEGSERIDPRAAANAGERV